jgi:hypothetical protein
MRTSKHKGGQQMGSGLKFLVLNYQLKGFEQSQRREKN